MKVVESTVTAEEDEGGSVVVASDDLRDALSVIYLLFAHSRIRDGRFKSIVIIKAQTRSGLIISFRLKASSTRSPFQDKNESCNRNHSAALTISIASCSTLSDLEYVASSYDQ
ncbi:hypothetical protein Tco_1491593 [Tanacetum coccineum]